MRRGRLRGRAGGRRRQGAELSGPGDPGERKPPPVRAARPARRPPARLSLRVDPKDAGAALGRFVSERGGVELALAEAAIARGGAYVSGVRVREPGARLKSGDRVEVHLQERGAAPVAPPALEATRLLHLDAEVALVDKPAGVLAQEGRAGGPDLAALVSALLAARGEAPQALLVHRLDRGTTGVCALARTRAAQALLLQAFREGRIAKEYLALCAVAAAPDASGEAGGADAFTIDLALGPDPSAAGRRRPDPTGEPASTRVQVLRRWAATGAAGAHALVAAFPETGRTHQVRVHLAARGLPLLGDVRYGGPKLVTGPSGARLDVARPLLHARRLQLPPRSEGAPALVIEAPVPLDLAAAIAFLG